MKRNEVIDKSLGLVYDVSTPEKSIESLLDAQSMMKSLEETVKKIKEHLEGAADVEHANHVVRVQNIQRCNYNKATLRQHVDEDTLDLFLDVSKGKVDKWLAEQVRSKTGVDTSAIRSALEPIGNAFRVIKLERISR